jgi:pSer/pThr/pTyr-binding forkhead associated (FHA) protein
MQVACSHCGKQHVLNDADVEKHGKVQFHCAKCGKVTVVQAERRPDMTMVISPLPSFARGDAGSVSLLNQQDASLRLPAEVNIVLTVLTGPSQGAVHVLKGPRAVVGRQGADIPINDPEISRRHCLIEVRDRNVNLKDLDSTNGTFFEDERARAAVLLDGAEFRIGSSLIRVNFQRK